MNHEFQAHVTSQAFVLTLSRPMIDLLDATERHRQGDEPWLTRLNASYALRRRGLLASHGTGEKYGMVITEEGKLVLELCKRAGLVVHQKIRRAA